MGESSAALKGQLINSIADTFGIPPLGGTEAQRNDYRLAEAAATCVADHVVATGNEAVKPDLIRDSKKLAQLGFRVGRAARDAGVTGMITPYGVSDITPCTEAEVASAYIRKAVNNITGHSSKTDIKNHDVFRTESDDTVGTITVGELLKKALEQDTFPGGATGRFR